ncbi:MAG TPA: cupin domain-containing protein [Burkholderiales bacterium]|jgi:mannose-6-phosphate isomerase-like protein (cupin superfamily)
MRHTTPRLALAAALAFGAGIFVAPLAQHMFSSAQAQGASTLQPAMIDLAGMKHDDIPATSNPEMHGKSLVVTQYGTIGIQSGNVKKHYHADTDEIQYIIEGSGAMWLGKERHDFKAGTLIIIPKGTAHGGTIVSSGPVKAIAIKLPPQKPTDTHFVD